MEGARFSSFVEVKEFIERYQQDNYVQFYINDSRTIAGARKRLPNRTLKSELHYYQVTYACVHGGRKYKSYSTGKRSRQRSACILWIPSQNLGWWHIGQFHWRLLSGARNHDTLNKLKFDHLLKKNRQMKLYN